MEIKIEDVNFESYDENGDWIPPEIIGPDILHNINAAVAEFIQKRPGNNSSYLVGILRLPGGSNIRLTLQLSESKKEK